MVLPIRNTITAQVPGRASTSTAVATDGHGASLSWAISARSPLTASQNGGGPRGSPASWAAMVPVRSTGAVASRRARPPKRLMT